MGYEVSSSQLHVIIKPKVGQFCSTQVGGWGYGWVELTKLPKYGDWLRAWYGDAKLMDREIKQVASALKEPTDGGIYSEGVN